LSDSISSKLHQVDNSKYWRTQNHGGNDVSWWQLLNLCMTASLTVFVMGFLTIGPGLDGSSTVEISDEVETFQTHNYTIHYVPEDQSPLEGDTTGRYYHGDEKEFYVEQGHSLGQTEKICNHEHMHDLGLLGEEAHDFVYRNDAFVESTVCDSFIELVKQNR